jgi:fructosamine-3-kinase
VLADGDRIAAFIDPAIYFADAEVELAFITLFGCFGPSFWETYHALRPIDPEFFATRRDLYNLYPLLVHTRLFGGGYVARVEATLSRFGC